MNSFINNQEPNHFIGRFLCLITGSSRGFGRAIAKISVGKDNIFKNAHHGSQFVLLSRNLNELGETKSIMEETGFDMTRFHIRLISTDLADIHQIESDFNGLLASLPSSFDKVLVFNNAGSLGDISKDILDYQWNILDYQKYFSLNVTSSIFMINSIINKFSGVDITLVQTSSLCAIQTMQFMSLYCAAKATMDMFLKCVAIDHTNVKTLNYAPGPLDTDMGKEMRDKNHSEETRKFFTELFNNGTIIDPFDSATKLLKLLQNSEFNSGAHIDYYDV